MNAFLISIANIQYVGIFASQLAAALDAESRYPTAWPAQVLCLGAPR